MAVLVPHFDLPFRYDSFGNVAVVEQDTVEDIENCVYAIMVTEPGDRDDLPAFGTPLQLLRTQPLPIGEIEQTIELWEPRAQALVDQEPDAIESLAAVITVKLRPDAR